MQSGTACYNALLAALNAGIRWRSGYPQIRYQRKMTELLNIPTGRSRYRLLGGWNEWLRLQGRSRFRLRPAALPLVLLLLALATLFLFGGDREYFYSDDDHHNWTSSQTMIFAENLSFRHNLLIFHYQYRDADGNIHYPSPYNRFPLGGYALIKLVILPFGDTDFKAKIYAGRILMLLLFSGAAVLAYLSLARIAGSRWDALTATLLAFSSYYLLHFADNISNEVTIDLFAVLLAVHGMVVFMQDGRFRQLVIKVCLALLLGWHVYAFLLPFIVFGVAAELFKARRFSPPTPILGRLKRYNMTLLRSRYLLLGVFALLFGIAILTFNFGNEYFALNGEVAVRELPSAKSAVSRLGADAELTARKDKGVAPQIFWPIQFYRIGHMTLPYAVNPYPIKNRFGQNSLYRDYQGIVLGVLAVCFCLAGLAFSGIRRRPGAFLLLATLTFSGFCWAWPLRYNVAVHDFESVFYIGIPLAAYILALRFLRRWHRGRLAPYFAAAALAIFIFSVSEIAGQDRDKLAVMAEQIAEYKAIRDLADDNATIYVPWRYTPPHSKDGLARSGGGAWAWAYFLSGKNLVFRDDYDHRKPYQAGDYQLTLTREDIPALLTPEHRHVFLYDWALYNKWRYYDSLGSPIIAAGGWQVYFTNEHRIYASAVRGWQVDPANGHLTYVSQGCANVDAKFFLHLAPRAAADLSVARQEYDYENRDFDFQRFGLTLNDGTCIIERPLPDYDIAAIRTGQYTEAGRIWGGEYLTPAPDPNPVAPGR